MIKLRVWRYLKREALKTITLRKLYEKYTKTQNKKLYKLFIDGLKDSNKIKGELRNKKKWGKITMPETVEMAKSPILDVESMPFASAVRSKNEVAPTQCARAKKKQELDLGALCHLTNFTAKKVF